MQSRKNKYERDRRGHIIDNTKEKETNKGKGKSMKEAVVSKNKFNVLEVEDNAQPILRIMDGKFDGNDKNDVKEQASKGANKAQQLEKNKQARDHTLSPNTGIKRGESRKVVEKVKDAHNMEKASLNKEEFDAKRVKKEVVEAANKEREAILREDNVNSIHVKSAKEARKETIIEWVHKQFGTSKDELRKLNVTTNHSCQDIPSQSYDDTGNLDDGNEVSSKKALWSDEVDNMDGQLGTTNVEEDKVQSNNQPGER